MGRIKLFNVSVILMGEAVPEIGARIENHMLWACWIHHMCMAGFPMAGCFGHAWQGAVQCSLISSRSLWRIHSWRRWWMVSGTTHPKMWVSWAHPSEVFEDVGHFEHVDNKTMVN